MRGSLAREARETPEVPPGARDDEAVRWVAHVASQGGERSDPRRHRCGPARGLPRRVLASGEPHPRAGRGERRALALPRDERARDADRAGTEPAVAASWPRLRRSLPRALPQDSARGAQRSRLHAAERTQARGMARPRAGRVLVGTVVRWLELPDPEGCQFETWTPRTSADLAARGRMEEARADRSARGAGRRGGVDDVTRGSRRELDGVSARGRDRDASRAVFAPQAPRGPAPARARQRDRVAPEERRLHGRHRPGSLAPARRRGPVELPARAISADDPPSDSGRSSPTSHRFIASCATHLPIQSPSRCTASPTAARPSVVR